MTAGWGTTSEGGDLANWLQELEIENLPDEQCEASYNEEFFKKSMFCAGFMNGGKDSCQVI